MSKIPTDPFILLSFVNTYLRDSADNLDMLCARLGVDRKMLEEKLGNAGFEYIPAINQFR